MINNKFNDVFNKIIKESMEETNGFMNLQCGEYPCIEDEIPNITVSDKIKDFISDEFPDVYDNLQRDNPNFWDEQMPAIEELVLEKLQADDPIVTIDEMDYLDFGRIILEVLEDLNIYDGTQDTQDYDDEKCPDCDINLVDKECPNCGKIF